MHLYKVNHSIQLGEYPLASPLQLAITAKQDDKGFLAWFQMFPDLVVRFNTPSIEDVDLDVMEAALDTYLGKLVQGQLNKIKYFH